MSIHYCVFRPENRRLGIQKLYYNGTLLTFNLWWLQVLFHY